MRKLLQKTAFVAALTAFTTPSSATVIEWTYNAIYEDLSNASGSFRYNSLSGQFSRINIEYSGGVTFPAATFDTANGTANDFGGILLDSANGPDFTGSVSLFFDTLTSLGNVNALNGNISNTDVSACGSSDCFSQTQPFVFANEFSLTGEIVAPIPLPAAFPLLATTLTAFGGLVAFRRKGRV